LKWSSITKSAELEEFWNPKRLINLQVFQEIKESEERLTLFDKKQLAKNKKIRLLLAVQSQHQEMLRGLAQIALLSDQSKEESKNDYHRNHLLQIWPKLGLKGICEVLGRAKHVFWYQAQKT
jgi:hypothetical protein